MFENKEVLVTGGTGFIGSNLVKRLGKHDAKLSVLVREGSDTERLSGLQASINFIKVDCNQPETIRTAIRQLNPYYIFHCYGGAQRLDAQLFVDALNESTTFLTSLVEPYFSGQNDRLEGFIHLCSSMVYERNPMQPLLSENTPMRPTSWRGLIKLNERNVCHRYVQKGYPIKIGRVFRAYGPWETINSNNTKFLAKLMDSIEKNIPIALGDNAFKRDYIYNDDIATALLAMCRDEVPAGTELNLCGMSSYGPVDIVEIIESLLGREIAKKLNEFAPNAYDEGDFYGDNSRAKRLLKWEPKVAIAVGLANVIDWYERYYACRLR